MDIEIESAVPSGEALARRLERHPAMKARFARVLDVLENVSGDLQRADDAERRAIDELRAMGQELLQGWAHGRTEKEAGRLEADGGVVRQSKKTLLVQHIR
jgi:hypothetical protein